MKMNDISEIHGVGVFKKYFKSFILAWREKQNIENIIKINQEKKKNQ